MKFAYFLISAILFIEYIVCQNLTMVYPQANNVFHTGDKILIEWQNRLPDGKPRTYDDLTKKKVVPLNASLSYATIALAYGESNDLRICHVMTDRASLNSGYYEWAIPHSITTRNNYVVEVGTDSDNIAFAGKRIINPMHPSRTA
ncbi:hypothetical protein BDF20DRAFT_662086 [Mycotypha africana]|uniref:uncharacterized protein n=1 Tax=Mycotypha africana TaxID=64632 RepID=UPI0022FFF0B3|nr:uncharacterized protein BDF20DRAFT_662086 [Mycotypha africana]KAI8973619.1 hypothetical protein BDF20DRAFT_662086 [Mycotypha africana]